MCECVCACVCACVCLLTVLQDSCSSRDVSKANLDGCYQLLLAGLVDESPPSISTPERRTQGLGWRKRRRRQQFSIWRTTLKDPERAGGGSEI